MDHCRCDGKPLGTSDHCAACGCEELEERCPTAGRFSRATGLRRDNGARPAYLTLTAARALLRPLGMTLRKRDGEYRVAHDMRDNEASAYYTNDLADALETGRAMARDTTRLCRPDVPTVHTGVTVVLRRMRSGLSAAECERMGFAQCADGWGCTACKTRAVDPMTHACPVRTVRP